MGILGVGRGKGGLEEGGGKENGWGSRGNRGGGGVKKDLQVVGGCMMAGWRGEDEWVIL